MADPSMMVSAMPNQRWQREMLSGREERPSTTAFFLPCRARAVNIQLAQRAATSAVAKGVCGASHRRLFSLVFLAERNGFMSALTRRRMSHANFVTTASRLRASVSQSRKHRQHKSLRHCCEEVTTFHLSIALDAATRVLSTLHHFVLVSGADRARFGTNNQTYPTSPGVIS